MAHYISTIKFSDRGATSIGETTQRTQQVRSAAQAIGASVIEIYWTLGDADGVLLFEAPDEETATALMLHVAAAGFVHTNTTRAFTADEIERVIAKAKL